MLFPAPYCCSTCKDMPGDNNINIILPDNLFNHLKVRRAVEKIMFHRGFCVIFRRFVNMQKCVAFFSLTHVKMGYMNLMGLCKFFKYVVVPRRYGMVNIILCRNKKNVHIIIFSVVSLIQPSHSSRDSGVYQYHVQGQARYSMQSAA